MIFLVLICISGVHAFENDTLDNNEYDDLSVEESNSIQEYDSISYLSSDTSKNISKDTINIKQANIHNTKIIVSNKTGYITTNVQLVATVADKVSNTYANGGKVVFKVNGITVGDSSLINGKSYYNYKTTGLSAKIYNLSATYSGSGIYASSKTNIDGKLNLTPLPTKMTVDVPSSYSTAVVLKATIVDKYNNKYLTDGQLLFKINGQSIGYANISNGKASITYDATKLYAGVYNISVVYGGTRVYSSLRQNSSLVIKVQNSFSFNDIKNTAVYVRNHYESNDIINSVYINKSLLHIQDFLYLMANSVVKLSKQDTSNVVYKSFEAPTSQTDTIKQGTLDKNNIVSAANRVITFMNTNKRAPTYVNTLLGYMGYYNTIYSFSKIMDVSTTTYLVSSCVVYNWKVLHPSNPKSRTIYITSDNIYTKSKDLAFMNTIKNILESKGYKVVIGDLGPNAHNTKIWAGSLPINAVQLSIFGGSDAGVIYDVCTRSFMRTKSNRMIFFAYNSDTAKDFRKLSWLERAHDDNYSPSSFKGISNPSDYLKSHGYDYVFTNSANAIVDALIKYIS